MNLRNVLRAYSLLRQLNDDETALLETLRQTNENERALLVEAMSDKPPQKKSSKKSAGGGGGAKSKHASSLGQQIQKRPRQTPDDESDDDNRFDGAGAQAAREELLGESNTRCHFTRSDGNPCKLLPDHNIHHLATANEYHEFQPAASSAAGAGD